MKNTITVRAGDISAALKTAASVVQSSAIVPILANVKLDATGKSMVVSTCDMEVLYQQVVPCAGDMVATVSAKRLSDIVAAVSAETMLTIGEADGRVEVKAGRSRWALMSLPADDFPSHMPMEGECVAMAIGGSQLAASIGRVAWAASVEISSPLLSGVYLNDEVGKVRFTASGRNMVMSLDTPDIWPKDAPNITIPTPFARLIERVASTFDGSVSMTWDSRKLKIVAGDISITGKLIDGTYHDYRRALAMHGDPVCADPASISAAVKRVRLASDERTMIFRIARTDGKLVVSVKCAGIGEASEEVAASCGEDIPDTGINAVYLMGMCDAIGGETIEMFQESEMAPMFFRRAVFDGAMGAVGAARVN